MQDFPLEKVKRDNSNIRKYSDPLWRALRKERFKKAQPDVFVNEMAAEQIAWQQDPHTDFKCDVEKFMREHLTKREAAILEMFLFGGGISQTEMGEKLGVSQPTVTNDFRRVLTKFKEYYYPERLASNLDNVEDEE